MRDQASLLRRGSFSGGKAKNTNRALTFHFSPIPSPYEKIRGLCGGERDQAKTATPDLTSGWKSIPGEIYN